MMGLAWISVTTIGGTAVPVRVEDIDRVAPNGGGARIHYKTGVQPLDVTESTADIYTALNGLWTDYLTALGDPA